MQTSMTKRLGDWNCSTCQHLNFSRRQTCQRCGDARPVGTREFGKYDVGSYGLGCGYTGGGSTGSRSFGGSFSYGGASEICVRPGDWYCSIVSCNAHNFASRSSCFKCGAFKDEMIEINGAFEAFGLGGKSARGSFGFGSSFISGGTAGPVWKSGDWICRRSDCKEHNFASRMECYRCTAPRGPGIINDN